MTDRTQISDARPSSPQGQGIGYNDVMSGPRSGNPTEPHGPMTPPIEPPGKTPTPGSSSNSNSDASAAASAASNGSISNRQVFFELQCLRARISRRRRMHQE